MRLDSQEGTAATAAAALPLRSMESRCGVGSISSSCSQLPAERNRYTRATPHHLRGEWLISCRLANCLEGFALLAMFRPPRERGRPSSCGSHPKVCQTGKTESVLLLSYSWGPTSGYDRVSGNEEHPIVIPWYGLEVRVTWYGFAGPGNPTPVRYH